MVFRSGVYALILKLKPEDPGSSVIRHTRWPVSLSTHVRGGTAPVPLGLSGSRCARPVMEIRQKAVRARTARRIAVFTSSTLRQVLHPGIHPRSERRKQVVSRR